MISCYEYVDAVIAHRNQVALRSDMKDYSYFRKDVTEEITDRLLVIFRYIYDHLGYQPQVSCYY